MRISGKSLELVQRALYLACEELHNQIATCPDVVEFAEDIAELQEEKRVLMKLAARVDAALEKEKKHGKT